MAKPTPVPPAAGCTLAIKAIPGAPRTEVCGWLGDAVKVKIHAPPLEGRANEAVAKALAGHLNIKKYQVELVSGAKSKHKVFRINA